jgi:hypothetical protein
LIAELTSQATVSAGTKAGSRFSARRNVLIAVAVVGVALAGCGPTAPPTDGDGVITVIEPEGTYVGTTCAAVGREFGTQLDEMALAIIDANRDRPEYASDPLSTTIIALVQGANDHLRARGLRDACDAPEFLAAADAGLSAELRAVAGAYITTPAVTYDEFHQYVEGQVMVIDLDEAPQPS